MTIAAVIQSISAGTSLHYIVQAPVPFDNTVASLGKAASVDMHTENDSLVWLRRLPHL